MRLWTEKLKEVLLSILPITLLVVLLNFTLSPLEPWLFARLLIGAAFITAGLTVFLVGVDLSVSPAGQHLGEALIRPNKLWIVAAAGLLLGFFISVAEPDLHILAEQVAHVTSAAIGKWSLVLVVSLGIAMLVALGLIRILYNLPLRLMLAALYGLILILGLLASSDYLAIAFDSSGATTGAMTVPFILALAMGIALKKKDSQASENDSFGLVALASAGAILAVLIMSLLAPAREFAAAVDFTDENAGLIFRPFLSQLLRQMLEALLAILPLFLILLLSQPLFLHLKKKTFLKVVRGFLAVWAGLALLLTGVNAGFMAAGREIGGRLVLFDNPWLVTAVGFVLGFVTILAEPAVHVLTRQIEAVTGGSVKRRAVLIALSAGVGTSVALSVLRVLIPGLQLWHILLPGYALAFILACLGPKLFVGIAFDSGGVASGPMTATFILAYTQGAANSLHSANVLIDGFGVIALVAMTPVITLQILGLIYQHKVGKRGANANGKSS